MAISHVLETQVLLWEGDTCPEVGCGWGKRTDRWIYRSEAIQELPSADLIDKAAHWQAGFRRSLAQRHGSCQL